MKESSQLFLVSSPTYSDNFTIIHNVTNRHGATPSMWTMETILLGVKLKISWKSVHPFFFVILLAITYQENRKSHCTQRFQCSSIKIPHFVSCLMFQVSLKFHENPFDRFSLMLVTDTDFFKNVGENPMFYPKNVADCSLYQIPTITKISWKSVNTFVRNVANRQTNKQTEMKTSSCLRRRQ